MSPILTKDSILKTPQLGENVEEYSELTSQHSLLTSFHISTLDVPDILPDKEAIQDPL